VLGDEVFSHYKSYSIDTLVPPFSRVLEYSKSYSKSARISVGPIPVKVTAGAEGTVGFALDFSAQIGPKAVLEVGPTVGLSAFGSGGVDIVVLGAGAKAELDLIEGSFVPTGELLLPCPPGESGFSFQMPVEFSSMSGRFYAWAKYYSPTLLNPLRIKYKEFTLVSWKGASYDETLVDWWLSYP
ncbi:MAG: hypothetical protein HKN04_15695, partial [Rhodothermaceae bacterium]|nr:hypothetical protein [Rhodothermaceae bacterium]